MFKLFLLISYCANKLYHSFVHMGKDRMYTGFSAFCRYRHALQCTLTGQGEQLLFTSRIPMLDLAQLAKNACLLPSSPWYWSCRESFVLLLHNWQWWWPSSLSEWTFLWAQTIANGNYS